MSRRRGSAMALNGSDVVAARGIVESYSYIGICQAQIAAVQAHAPQARFILASTSNVYDMDNHTRGAKMIRLSRSRPIRPARSQPRTNCARADSPGLCSA